MESKKESKWGRRNQHDKVDQLLKANHGDRLKIIRYKSRKDRAILSCNLCSTFFRQSCESLLKGSKPRCGCQARLGWKCDLVTEDELNELPEVAKPVKPRTCQNKHGNPGSAYCIDSRNALWSAYLTEEMSKLAELCINNDWLLTVETPESFIVDTLAVTVRLTRAGLERLSCITLSSNGDHGLRGIRLFSKIADGSGSLVDWLREVNE